MFLLSSSFFLLLLLPVLASSSMIQSTCTNTSSYAFCVETLESASTSFVANSTKDFATISMRIALSSAVNTSSYLFGLAKGSADGMIGEVLRGCGQRYVNAQESLEWGIGAVEDENYDYAAMHVGGAKEYPGMCGALFKGAGRGSYPKEVARRARELVGFCQLALDIVNYLLG